MSDLQSPASDRAPIADTPARSDLAPIADTPARASVSTNVMLTPTESGCTEAPSQSAAGREGGDSLTQAGGAGGGE